MNAQFWGYKPKTKFGETMIGLFMISMTLFFLLFTYLFFIVNPLLGLGFLLLLLWGYQYKDKRLLFYFTDYIKRMN